jgi:hypothetical protein
MRYNAARSSTVNHTAHSNIKNNQGSDQEIDDEERCYCMVIRGDQRKIDESQIANFSSKSSDFGGLKAKRQTLGDLPLR